MPFILANKNGTEVDVILLKEIFEKENIFSINIGSSFKHVGGTVGWTPPVAMKSFEVHVGPFWEWKDIAQKEFGNFKIGIGASAKF